MLQKFYFVVAVVSHLLFSPLFGQNTYYVSENGNDGNDGLTQLTAFETLQHAADIVSAGDSVLVMQGTYVGFDLRTGGTQNSPIIFKVIEADATINQHNAVTNDGINIENADWVVVDGFKVINTPRAGIRIAVSDNVVVRNNYCNNNQYWGIFTGFTDNILIENNTCSNSVQQHGIYVSNSGDNPVVRNNICFGNNDCGIQLNADVSQGGDGIITNAVIESNIIFENGTSGGSAINLDGVQDSKIYNNLLYNNHSSGISLFMIDGAEGSKNNKVYNNTIVNPTTTRWNININSGSTGNSVYNNILINHHSFRGSITVDESSIAGFQSDYNIVEDRLSPDGDNTILTLSQWQGLGYDLHSMLADPDNQVFADTSTSNYHLLQNAQAVDVGTSLVSSVVTVDLDDVSRPQGSGYDIGCYEFSSTTGITEENIPEKFQLFQNYPNPFNPETIISWQSPMAGRNILKVFNILGNEVATLIDKEMPSGKYEIRFNGSGLTSGIYLVRLQVDSFVQTKKMSLIK
jgi:parallel beta-helix repeat protein